MAGQCGFLFKVSRAMVGHGKIEAGGHPECVLVLEPCRLIDPSRLQYPQARLCVHLRLSFHLDTVYPKFNDQPSDEENAFVLRGMPHDGARKCEILPWMRCGNGPTDRARMRRWLNRIICWCRQVGR